MGWKYIMVTNKLGDSRLLVPVIFSDKLVHSEVYQQVRTIMPGWRSDGGVGAFSAGSIEHVRISGLGGKSETLGINSHPTDASTITSYSYRHGFI